MTSTLGQADVRILEHIRRFRITTPEYAQSLCGFQSLDETKSALQALSGLGYILAGQLFADRIYYALSRSGYQLLQAAPTESKAINPNSLVEAYGTLAFCSGTNREKITRDQFIKGQAKLRLKGAVEGNYYLDSEDGTPKLGFIAVDPGRDISRFIGKVDEKVLARREKASGWSGYFCPDDHRFVLAFVTHSDFRAAKFSEYFQRTRPKMPQRIQIVPELFRILNRL